MSPIPYFSPRVSLDCINKKKITAFHGVPTMFIAMLGHADFAKTDFSYMRTGIMAGSPCPIKVMQDVIDKMHMTEICITYGQTEASPGCTMSKTTDSIETRVNTVGGAMFGVECKIVDPETGEDLPDGVASIGDFAFGWCQNLSSLTVRVADPATIELGLIPFFRGANAVDCTLRVPVGSKTKYENADLWKDFAPNIEELTSDGIDNATTEGQQADKAERVYSRDGVQLRGTLGQQQKGVYIVGGKKVVKR